jgi:hypothetical protein
MSKPVRYVVMPAIPGPMQRGRRTRTGLGYMPYARTTWHWWCQRQGIEFILLDQPVAYDDLVGAPPVIQRWIAVERLLTSAVPGTEIAVVDADTMIRWDAPNFFELTGDGLGVVQAGDPRWITHSTAAYQEFFPGIHLPWWQYFNAGLVVVGQGHLEVLRAVITFYQRNRAALEAVQQQRRDVGVDQTVLNFLVRQTGVPVTFLPLPFNLTHCLRVPANILAEIESPQALPRLPDVLPKVMDIPGVFDFVEYGYVWHFTNAVNTRAAFMRETWRRVQDHYAGALDPDADVNPPALG